MNTFYDIVRFDRHRTSFVPPDGFHFIITTLNDYVFINRLITYFLKIGTRNILFLTDHIIYKFTNDSIIITYKL
jgi:hypothetical protein